MQTAGVPRRRVFMILSPHALPYASNALDGLLHNVLEPLQLHLITDSAGDRDLLFEELGKRLETAPHACSFYAKEDLADAEATVFAQFPNLRLFRNGHPCWRKVTDPILLSRSGDEMVLLDPDLHFPNRFFFEKTPGQGVLLMWQRPNCLFPPEVVDAAFDERIRLARHVDIGVAQWRVPVDLEWLEWLLGKLLGRLGGGSLPRVMHVEAIVWAAIAMRIGGGYLAASDWHCWRRSQAKRLLQRAGVPGHRILRSEPFSKIKCFHAGGEAKFWLAEAQRRGWLAGNSLRNHCSPVLPFVELTPERYQREQFMKNWLKRLGYYRVIQSA
jgi:hypothetical protein